MLSFNELPEINSERWLSPDDFQDEEWREIPGLEGKFYASNYGRLSKVVNKGLSERRIVKIHKNKYSYYLAKLDRFCSVHRVIAKTFLQNPYNKPCVDHIDTNKSNNMANNLKWVTAKENSNNPLTKQHIIEDRKKRKCNVFCRKRIAKYDKENNFVCSYESAMEAALKNNISISNISNAVHYKERIGRYKKPINKTAGGFYWRYIE